MGRIATRKKLGRRRRAVHRPQAAPGRIDTLLEWWQRDLDDGLGELPFPPEFPKMPGEPPRVQPSRARKPD